MKSLRLKAGLLVDGIDVDPAALQGVGTRFKEQNHGLFGWDMVNHKGLNLPDDFVLSDGTVVQFRYNPVSPYRLQANNNGLSILYRGDVAGHAKLIPRPRFYDRLTSSGHPMRKIAQIGGEDCFFVCYQNYCSHFAGNEQCAFCNLVPTKKTYDAVLSKKGIDEIGEAAAAAFSEGMCNHILLTGGCFSHEKEVDLVCKIVESIRGALATDTVPGTILPSAATEEDDIKRYRDTGIGAIGYSVEIWDEAYYRAICPGKARATSHEDFVEAIAKAVRVFGSGRVYGVLVLGLEPRDSFLRGVRELADLGANVVPFVWSPNPGSRLEGHRAPTAEWYVGAVLEAGEVLAHSNVPQRDENHCYRCDGNSLLHDVLRMTSIDGRPNTAAESHRT
ncbi:MAG: radical SAM protein [Kiritimatiellaeota bacterium]|nr:radical SAM protein [Kiritimatiellota bacterium]